MTDLLNKIKWSWLIIAPVVVALWGWWQVGAIACDLEMQAVVSHGLGAKAAFVCPWLGYDLRSEAPEVGAADLAAVRIAVVAFMIATLFGVIGVLAGYKAFLPEPSANDFDSGLACLITTKGRGAEVFCHLVGEGARIKVTELSVTGDGGTILQTMPARDLSARETWRWTVLTEHAVRPSKMEVAAVLEDAEGKISDLSSKWEKTANGFKCVLLNRVWR